MLQGRYRVVRKLGQGGMGAIYEALDTRLKSTVALKQTLVTGEVLEKAFEREAQLLSGLHHASLPHVIDYFTDADGKFLVMQYIPGEDLGQILRREQRPAPPDAVLRWADQLLDVLDYLHSHEPPILHRDIKPDNLKLTQRGTVMLLDFGLAKGTTGAMTAVATGSVLGYTPSFAPLEQIRGLGTDAGSDIYSAAATLYALLTAQTPIDAISRADSILNGAGDPLPRADAVNPQVPTAVADVLHAALALKRDDRPRSAAVMRTALAGAGARAASAPPAPPPPPPVLRTVPEPQPPRPTAPAGPIRTAVPTFGAVEPGPSAVPKLVAIGAAVVLVLAVAIGAALFWPRGAAPEQTAEARPPDAQQSPAATGGATPTSTPAAPEPAKANAGSNTNSRTEPPRKDVEVKPDVVQQRAAAPSDDVEEPPRPEPPKVTRVSGGVLAGKAISRPQPAYPQMAKAAGVEGAVVVEVTVSESGSVISARAVSGHPLLRDASVQAARGWTFSPTMYSGVPVKVIGTITFNFRKS